MNSNLIMARKRENLFWEGETGKKVVKSSIEGAKTVGKVVIAGLAIGLGLSAYNSVSG